MAENSSSKDVKNGTGRERKSYLLELFLMKII